MEQPGERIVSLARKDPVYVAKTLWFSGEPALSSESTKRRLTRYFQ